MNNFAQKNKILQLHPLLGTPYPDFDNIKLPTANLTNIPETYSADVNNAFQQMVDCDLYLRNRLMSLANSIDGPKPANGVDAAGYDGYKFAKDDGWQMNFYRKHFLSLQSSLKCIKPNVDIKFIDYFASSYFALSEDRIFTSVDGKSWTENNCGFTICSYHKNDTALIIGSTNGCIYAIDAWQRLGELSLNPLQVLKPNTHITGISSVLYETEHGKFKTYYWIASKKKVKCIALSQPEDEFEVEVVVEPVSTPSGINKVHCALAIPKDGRFVKAGRSYIDLSKVNIKNNLLIGTDKGLWRLKDQSSWDNIVLKVPVKKLILHSSNEVFALTENGAYTYYPVYSLAFKTSSAVSSITAADWYTSKSTKCYACAIDSNKAYSTEDFRAFNSIVELSSGLSVNDMYTASDRAMLFATNKGIWATDSSYEVCCDSIRFTEEDGQLLYQQMLSSFQHQICSAIEDHIGANHTSYDIITKVNFELMDKQFSNLTSTFTTVSYDDNSKSIVSASCDYIYKTVFGNTRDNEDIQVRVCNYATGYKWQSIDSSFIMKLWKSGLNELYMHIPTTNTYYINHISGVSPVCQVDPRDVEKRQNLRDAYSKNNEVKMELNSILSDNVTSVDIMVLSTQYELDYISQIQLNGDSLPLGIYKDTRFGQAHSADGYAFESTIQPSLIQNDYALTSTEDEMYVFHGYCFGTDSQSFKLQAAAKTTKYYDGNIVTITYHGNGHRTLDNRTEYVQKFRCIDLSSANFENKQLRAMRFDPENNVFLGWATKYNPAPNDETALKFIDKQMFSKDDYDTCFKERKNLDLYAIWLVVDWQQSHTQLRIDANKGNPLSDDVWLAKGDKSNGNDKLILDYNFDNR